MTFGKIIANNLTVLMKRNDLNITRLSEELGISRQSITKILKGELSYIHFDSLEKLSKYFMVEANLFLKENAFNQVETKIKEVSQ